MQIALSNHLKLLEKNFPLDFGCKSKIPPQHRVNGFDSEAECHPLICSNLQRMQKEYHLEFVEIFCHTSIREIDISKKVTRGSFIQGQFMTIIILNDRDKDINIIFFGF